MAEHRVIDARGSFCPGPLMELIAAMKKSAVGDTFELLSTDDGSAKDVPEWVNKVGHAINRTERDSEGVWHIVVQKMK
jgi:tRNA 2-thiouridine synthesizing protein A